MIIDPHHHLWHARPDRYLLDDLAEDLATGHDVRATVFIQCGSAYRKDGVGRVAPVGETEFVTTVAAASESRNFRACAGSSVMPIAVGRPDRAVLLAHVAAGGSRFKGNRHSATMTLASRPRHRRARRPACSSIRRFVPEWRGPALSG